MIYKDYKIERTGPHENDFRVSFPGRTRWGTIDELTADVDAWIAGSLPAPRRGGN